MVMGEFIASKIIIVVIIVAPSNALVKEVLNATFSRN